MQTSTRENWLITGIVVLALLLIFAWTGGDNKANAPVGGTATTTGDGTITIGSPSGTTTTEVTPGENAGTVMVNDQVAGTEVVIERVNLEKPGWVVVRQGDRVLGVRCFSAGTNQGNMTVEITDGKKTISLLPGTTYSAELRDDNDGQCVYNGVATEAPIVDAKGDLVKVIFKTFAAGAQTATTTSTN